MENLIQEFQGIYPDVSNEAAEGSINSMLEKLKNGATLEVVEGEAEGLSTLYSHVEDYFMNLSAPVVEDEETEVVAEPIVDETAVLE